jgi:hypothetical protein
MNTRSCLSARAATLGLVAALGAIAPFLTPVAHSAPKQQQLEIWPGRRVLLVLPLTVSSNWNADPALGRAIIPLATPELQRELTNTGKFSITLPYRFDPILRRALTEKRVAENDITALLASPSLETSRPVTDKLAFDQPVMVADIKLEELRVGGTPKMPTVQIQASGVLFEQGNPNPVKKIVVTSRPVMGKTPSERLSGAARAAFAEIAAEFVAAPPAFDLPMPEAPPEPVAPAAGAAGTTSGTSAAAGVPAGAAPARMPMTPPAPMGSVATPNGLPVAPGMPFVPQLPAGQPPLGVGAGAPGTVGR